MRDRCAGISPIGRMADIAESHTGFVQVIRERDRMELVGRPEVVDDGSRSAIEQDRDYQRVGKRNPDRCRRRSGRVLFIDLLDWNQEILAAFLDRRRRAVHEPDDMTGHCITGHLPGMDDVVEDREPSVIVLTRTRKEAEIRSEGIRCGEVSDRTVAIDRNL